VRATPTPSAKRSIDSATFRSAAVHSVALAGSCLVSYWLVTRALNHIHSVSKADDQLGGMWAVIATVFVYRETYQQSMRAALSRVAATVFSFVLCLIYLLILPFHPLGLAVLIGVGTFALMLTGRDELIVTTGITTAVVLVVAALSPHDAWQQPILRLADTVIGVAVGAVVARLGLLATHRESVVPRKTGVRTTSP
jgi:hypothetical protein